jgi:hypothetical protein
MELLLALQGANAFFVGGPPRDVERDFKNYCLCMGYSEANWVPPSRQKKGQRPPLASTMGPRSLRTQVDITCWTMLESIRKALGGSCSRKIIWRMPPECQEHPPHPRLRSSCTTERQRRLGWHNEDGSCVPRAAVFRPYNRLGCRIRVNFLDQLQQEQQGGPVPAAELLNRHGEDREHAACQYLEYAGDRFESHEPALRNEVSPRPRNRQTSNVVTNYPWWISQTTVPRGRQLRSPCRSTPSRS